MDNENRVLRLDSFSKVFSSGIRIGMVTGPKYLVTALQLDQQVSGIQASGLSQILVEQTLNFWGQSEFDKHIDRVQQFYKKQRDAFMKSCKKHLTGLAEWNKPKAGMFVWIKLNNIEDSETLIFEKAVAEKVLMVPGKYFMPNMEPTPYVRASFSTSTPEQIDTAIYRLSKILKSKEKK